MLVLLIEKRITSAPRTQDRDRASWRQRDGFVKVQCLTSKQKQTIRNHCSRDFGVLAAVQKITSAESRLRSSNYAWTYTSVSGVNRNA
jgi:hypothetical protein